MKNFVTEDAAGMGSAVGTAINADYLADELPLVGQLASQARLDAPARERVAQRAILLVEALRKDADSAGGIDEFLQTYGLDSQEGVLLMCLAEALLRIPDAATADRLIADRLGRGDWRAHLDDSSSLFVNASTFGLMLTGALLVPDAALSRDPQGWFRSLIGRIGEPVARTALRQAMRILSQQFIFGTDLASALKRAQGARIGERYSFDMLGEAAMTTRDARHHLEAYRDAVAQVGRDAQQSAGATPAARQGAAAPPLLAVRNSVSVKLSALHPRYELAQRERVHAELLPAISELLAQAEQAGIGLTIDAEECERLELSLQLFEQLLRSPAAARPGQLGLAVQAYQKRSTRVIDWLVGRVRDSGRHITLRLVKGAYWDTEIKRAQQSGLASYPVFTRKQHTDIAYLACARRLAANRDVISAQFATHNAHTVAYVAELYGAESTAFEYQRLHGMGEALYEAVRGGAMGGAHACRVYAPVGPQSELLPYLVRRLLENGANTSFVHRAGDRGQAASEVVRDPTDPAPGGGAPFSTTLAEAPQMFAPARRNSLGINLHDSGVLTQLAGEFAAAGRTEWLARPLIGGTAVSGQTTPVVNPADHADLVGECVNATPQQVQQAAIIAADSWPEWDRAGGGQRAAVLERAADLFERERAGLLARCVREAGKTLADSVSEWREAIDFLRYYAAQARSQFTGELALPGPAGEANSLRLRARGVFGCISPWNFPLAIFTGQVAAALAAGNSVLAKPAEQTPLTAAFATALLHEAGVPASVLQLLPGDGAVGAAITGLDNLAGVAFTGSSETAQLIARSLAARNGAIATLIAETGGQNALIADSSALVEQVVQDLLASSFNSAGQRCSAVRVVYVQEELAPRLIEALCGAMDEMVLGDPALLATDIGPLIDAQALAGLEMHARRLGAAGKVLHRGRPQRAGLAGFYFAPLLAEIGSIAELEAEVFGPALHVVRFRASDIAQVVDDINATGYGLTLGIHTRIESRALQIAQRARVGNVYVNRNTIGAVVGVQPFGGCNRSGTGPKAGGPHYLPRFATEQCLTVNTAAVGGNAALLSQG